MYFCSGPPAEMLNDYARRVDLLRGIAEAKKLVLSHFFQLTSYYTCCPMLVFELEIHAGHYEYHPCVFVV